MIESILPSKHCRFPEPEEAKQPQGITQPVPCIAVDRVFFRVFFILPPLAITRPSFVSSLHRTEFQSPVAYLYSFEHISAEFSCAFGAGVVNNLEFRHGDLHCLVCSLLWKLKFHNLLQLFCTHSRVFGHLPPHKSGGRC